MRIVGWIAALVLLVVACGSSSEATEANTPDKSGAWAKMDSRTYVRCWNGTVLFWSTSDGSIAAINNPNAETAAAAGC
jgi:hypothetical protein